MNVLADTLTVARKEMWELRYSSRNLIWFAVLLGLFAFLLLRGETGRGLLTLGTFAQITPAFVAVGLAGQMSLDSMLGEKKAGTLEVLISTRLSPAAIVVGKALAPSGVGYLVSLLAVIALVGFSFITLTPGVAWLAIVLPLFAAYFASCLTIMMTIVIHDEKMTPIASAVLTLIPLALLGRFSSSILLSIGIGPGTLAAIVLCAGLTWLAATALKRVPLVTML